MRSLLVIAGMLLGCAREPAPPPIQAPAEPRSAVVALPARFEANRIFVEPVMQDGRKLRLYTDSGGGTQFLYPEAVERLHLSTQPWSLGGESGTAVAIPAWKEGAAIPPPRALHQSELLRDHYLVVPERPIAGSDEDGFLGQGWFGGRVWTFDYPGKQLLWREDGALPPHAPEEEIPLHQPRAPGQEPSMAFGRITVRVDGEDLDLLFDTGATLNLAPEGLQALGDGGARVRGTSFIAANVFARWRAKHADWRVIEHAEERTHFAILEVPEVQVANQKVGPVWFTFRPDKSFHEFMSSMMDARVEGALGGSALQYLRVSVDYVSGKAVFQRP